MHTNNGHIPLHWAALRGHLGLVRVLISEFKANINAHAKSGDKLLHCAADGGHLDVVRVLLSEFKADANAHNNNGDTPLHLAAIKGHLELVRVLISEFKVNVNVHGKRDNTPLHWAAGRGHMDVVRVLISEFKANVNACSKTRYTPLHYAVLMGHLDVVRVLISEFKADVGARTYIGDTPLHQAAYSSHLDVVTVLISEFKADVGARTYIGDTPLHQAAYSSHLDVVTVLISEFKADVGARTYIGDTPLHQAAYSSHLDVVTVLISEFKADVGARTDIGDTPLHQAAYSGHLDVVTVLISEFKADVGARTDIGDTPLHEAAHSGHLDVVTVLISEFKADVGAGTDIGDTPLHEAAHSGHLDVVRVLILEFEADININACDNNGAGPLHQAARMRHLNVAKMLLSEFKADVSARTNNGDTPLHEAARGGHLDVVRMLISEFKANINAHDNQGRAPINVVAENEKVALALMSEFHCDTKGGTPYIHTACERGWVNLVRALIQKHGTSILTARDDEGNIPLHVAAMSGKEDAVLSLTNEFGCDVNATGLLGRSLLHSACASYNSSLVRLVSQHISPWVVDDNGDTPLHMCVYLRNTDCVKALLALDPPVMLRNNLGQTPRDVAETRQAMHIYGYIDTYMKKNKGKIYSQYEVVQSYAKKKYSRPEPITRAFVIGNPGAGKSSLVETLKREGFLDSFFTVSESSVPPHTAGIVPSIHTSKHYGRVLFYDFAGDAEYYSSHAAILENLASSRKGDNVFLLVIDMTKEMAEIKKTFHYWLSFIKHQQFHGLKPRLIVVGSHLDLLTEVMAKAKFQMFYDITNTKAVHLGFFMLDCCKPKSKQIAEIQTLLSRLTKDSPRYTLSPQSSTLLGLLERDFSNVPARSIQDLLTHIEETGIQLVGKSQSLYPILLELHELGLLFVIGSSNRESSNVILHMSQLTNIVHKSLFSEKVILKERFEKEGLSFSFSAGIVPQSILAKILPENITTECLVQLQYCQEISHAEAHVFPSLKVSDSTDQSFLFFPALCSADKSKVEWVTPPDLSYGIGWLARCTDPCDYLSPRFHHVLMLRLVSSSHSQLTLQQTKSHVALLTSVSSSVAAQCGRQGCTG